MLLPYQLVLFDFSEAIKSELAREASQKVEAIRKSESDVFFRPNTIIPVRYDQQPQPDPGVFELEKLEDINHRYGNHQQIFLTEQSEIGPSSLVFFYSRTGEHAYFDKNKERPTHAKDRFRHRLQDPDMLEVIYDDDKDENDIRLRSNRIHTLKSTEEILRNVMMNRHREDLKKYARYKRNVWEILSTKNVNTFCLLTENKFGSIA